MEGKGNKGSNNDSLVEQEGIFSSPDLSVNSENLEEIKPELSEENKSRIASAFAKTDATQKQDQLSEQMAEQDAVSGTVIPVGGIGSASGASFGNNSITSTATGDIRIPGAKKKSKAPLLILATIVLLAVVGGVVAWVLLGQRSDDSTQSTTALFSTEEAFAKYANYLLFGEEKTVLDGEYDSNTSYTLNQQLSAETYDQAYWDRASELLDQSAASLSQADDPVKDQLISALDNYRQNFNFVKAYKRTGDLDEEALFGTYLTSGMEGVAAALGEFYAGISSLGSEVATAYVAQRTQQYTDMMNIYNVYGELGCLQSGTLVESACATPSAEQQARIMEFSESLSLSARQADNILENIIRNVASYCWDLDGWLSDPRQFEESANETTD